MTISAIRPGLDRTLDENRLTAEGGSWYYRLAQMKDKEIYEEGWTNVEEISLVDG